MPDLAERWSVDPTGVVVDRSHLRDDARVARRRAGHRGRRRVHDPDAPGPRLPRARRRLVERGHGPADGAAHGDRSRSTTPLGGFLQAATQPIAPAHLLATCPSTDLPDDPFGRQPIGSGPFAVASLPTTPAELIPAASLHRDGAAATRARRRARDRLAGDAAARRPPEAARAVPGRHRLPLLRRPGGARRSLPGGRPRRRLGSAAGAGPRARRRGREPGPALSGLDADGRPAQPPAGPPGVRRTRPSGRRCSRPSTGGRIINDAFAMAAGTATGADPAVVAAVRPDRRPAGRPTTPAAAKAGLNGRRLDAGSRRLAAARARRPRSTSSCSARTRRRTRPRTPPRGTSPATGRRSG